MKRRSAFFVRSAIVTLVVILVLVTASAVWRGSRAIHTAADEVRTRHEFRFRVQALQPPSDHGFEVVTSPDVFVQAAQFQGHLFIAGPARLLEYSPEGKLIQQYLVGTELP